MTPFETLPFFSDSEADQAWRKASGSYYTPENLVRSLVSWATRSEADRMLDPSCGDGRFLLAHRNSVGIEQDQEACHIVHAHSPGSLIHEGDFFAWASETRERFDCAAGNPPFIRYQSFNGQTRRTAQRLCERHGVKFSALSSSWAPFLVTTATLLKPGGRMAFVVPAEIGHAQYSAPVLEFFADRFSRVHIIAVRNKLFRGLSEDCWLLYAEGYGSKTTAFHFTALEDLEFYSQPPKFGVSIPISEWRQWNRRLRPFLLSGEARKLYRRVSDDDDSKRLGDLAKVGIGYVTGANDFFHLRPTTAKSLGIPENLLYPAVRNGKSLTEGSVTNALVKSWLAADEQVLLLRIAPETRVPISVKRYLDSSEGKKARQTYKCRNRDPWYSVPDVTVPNGFLTYMSGHGPRLVRNQAKCVGTNSVHVIHLGNGVSMKKLLDLWGGPFTAFSCEVEGHPLGGGMLKIEPREAARILLTESTRLSKKDRYTIEDAIATLKRWRHYD